MLKLGRPVETVASVYMAVTSIGFILILTGGIALQTNCVVADIAEKFDAMLKNYEQADYLLKYFFHSIYLDRKTCQQPNGTDILSKKRGLRLTIDGVHLNEDGARIYKEIVESKIKQNGR